MKPLEKAVEVFDGKPGLLAAAIGESASVVSNWRARERVPAEHCRAIETATKGAVTRYELRPDIFGPAPDEAA